MNSSLSKFNFLEYSSDCSQSSTSNSDFIQESTENLTKEKEELRPEFHSSGNLTRSSNDNCEIILSVYWKRGKLGAAYYSCSTAELYLLNDTVDIHPDFNNLRTLVQQAQPSKILTCGGLSEDFTKTISDLNGELEEHTGEKNSSKNLIFMSTKKKELSYDSCKRYILGLRLGFEPEYLNEEDHVLFMNSHIDFAQESMVVSLGMLVKFLEKYLTQVNLHYDSLQVIFLNHISLTNLVSIDENTYKALQIFNAQVHPSAFKRSVSGSNREGLSLFGIFNRCKSNAGVKRMKEIFTNPSRNLEELNERLDTVEFCCKPQHQHVVQNLVDCIKRVESITVIDLIQIRRYESTLYCPICRDPSCSSTSELIWEVISELAFYPKTVVCFMWYPNQGGIRYCKQQDFAPVTEFNLDLVALLQGTLASIYRARANIGNWRSLYCSLYNAILIGEICQKHSSHSKLLEKVAKSITQNIHEVTHYINQVIDFEESSAKNHFTVRNGIDGKLDLLRQTYAQIPEVLVKVAEIELQDLPCFIEQCSIIYITELGYLLSVPIWKGDGTRASDYVLPNFEVKFVVNQYVHYKTPRCVELDRILGDSVANISEIESKIMITLIQFIHTRIADVVCSFRLIAELDCVISFAMVASENNYRRPVLTQERNLEITQGRHPLQELCVDNFVSNDTKFESERGRIKILTGPNASGKSVYLKQVALIAYMAHIGSFVPAESATIPILDHIHSRVQSVESISTRMSAFLIDLKQISLSLYNSTPSSLVLIDEFGKGTTETDGLSLFAASVIHFIERKENCPFVLLSTHFHRLPSLLPPTPLVQLQVMEYLIENEEIVYLYKTKDGSSGSSLTCLAAKTAGLSKEAVNRCLEILNSTNPLKSNYKLEITKTMVKEIMYMKKIFKLALKGNEGGIFLNK